MSIAAAKATLAKRIKNEKALFVLCALNALSGVVFHDLRWAIVWTVSLLISRRMIDLLYSQVRIADKIAEAKAQIDALEAALRGPRR